MSRKFTAVYKKSGKWYLGWVEEIPGVNTQGRTLKETKENLKDAVNVFFNPLAQRSSTIPRHNEIENNLAKKICTDLGIEAAKKK